MRARRFTPLVVRLGSLAVAAAAAVACSGDFDTTRQPENPSTTLGEDIYTVMCDRVGASSFSEDLEGRSFRSICHKGPDGWKGTKVDVSTLPPVQDGTKAGDARRLSVAKLETMAAHRAELIEALDATFPDQQIADPFAKDGTKVRLHDALAELARRLTPLYESTPYDADKGAGNPYLLPANTQAVARFFDALASSDAARKAFAQIGSRQGYRPLPVALGALRAFLAYPRLRQFSNVLLDRTGPGGKLEGSFQHLLNVVREELADFKPDPAVQPITVDTSTVQPSRARMKIEILSELLLAQDPAFHRINAAPHFIANRDQRGFVVPYGSKPGIAGSVPAPFVDDGHGYAMVDALGRFVADAKGTPLFAPPPFQTPDVYFANGFTFDPKTGQAQKDGKLLYDYIDTSQTLASSVLYDFQPLVATQMSGNAKAPSTLMKTLEGAYFLYGDKHPGNAKYPIPYQAFDTSNVEKDLSSSPLLALTYATGQLLGAPGSDDYLGAILDLHQNHPDETGRALSLAWAIKNKSKDPAYAAAVLADTSTFWDEMADWIAKVARVGVDHYTGGDNNPTPRGLMQDITLAMADPATIQFIPASYAPSMQNNDRLTYDPNDINGPPLDLDSGAPVGVGVNLSHPVDRSQPDQDFNRSAFQRFIHVIAAASKVKSCNKMGTLVKSPISLCGLTINLTYPLNLDPCCLQFAEPVCNALGIACNVPSIGECGLFEIDDLGVFFIDSTLPFTHPRRAHLKVKDTTLTGLVSAVGALVPKACGEVNLDAILEKGTGVKGLTTMPTPEALERLVYFGAESTKYPNLPDTDPFINDSSHPANGALNTFISNSLDPVGTAACPVDSLGVNQCQDFSQTLRGFGQDTFFISETPYLGKHPDSCLADCAKLTDSHMNQMCVDQCSYPTSGFFEGMRPLLTAFANYSYDPNPGETCLHVSDNPTRCAGEQLFVDLVSILDKHWSTDTSGLSHYEDFLAWVFGQSDLFGTMGDLVPVLRDQQYVSPRVKPGQVRSGLEVTTEMLSFLFDQQVASQLGITNMDGSTATIWNDNQTIKPQVTPYDLFVQALRAMDARFDKAGDTGAKKKQHWREARSELVDKFLMAENGQWDNPAVAKALPVLGELIREQINANCPDRESTGNCDWARNQLYKKLGAVFEGPLFAAINDLQEQLRGDDEARLELEALLTYLVELEKDPDTLISTLTSLADILQVLHDDADLAPILNAVSTAAAPGTVETGGKSGTSTSTSKTPGMGDQTIKLMKVLLDDAGGDTTKVVDRYHVMDSILKNLVTPPADGKRAPLEVIVDVLSDVNRIDAADQGTLTADDYKAVFGSMRDFMTDQYRGLEQFYTIVRHRNLP